MREARELLMRAVREYRPSGDIADLVWRRSETHRTAEGKVSTLQARRITGRRDPGRVGDTPN